MVGCFLLAARSRDFRLSQQFLAERRICGVCGNRGDYFAQIKRRRVHRIVNAGVADVARHIQAFSNTHGTSRGNAFSGGSGHKTCGVERHGRHRFALLLFHRDNACLRSIRNGIHNALCLFGGLEARRFVTGGKFGWRVTKATLDHPVILGDKRQALAFTRHNKRQRRRLHATRRARLAIPGKLHQRQIAREHRAPHKVDVAARCTSSNQLIIHAYQVVEGVRNLLLRERGVTRAGNRHARIHFQNAAQRIGTNQLAFAVKVGCNNNGICLLRQILQRTDDFFFLGKHFDGRVHQIRQRIHVPALQIQAVFEKRTLLFEGRFRQACREFRLNRLSICGYTMPTKAFCVSERFGEIRFKNVAAQTNGNPVLPFYGKTENGSGKNLVGLGA